MKENCSMAELIAEYGDRFDILEEIKKENKKLYHPELVEEEQPVIVKEKEEKVEEKKKDNTPKDITIKCKKCGQLQTKLFIKKKAFINQAYAKIAERK